MLQVASITKFVNQCTANKAMDIDNESDYKEMVQKIHDTASDPHGNQKFG